MKIIITGASGFIGSHLVDRLLATTQHELILVSRRPERLKQRWPQRITSIHLNDIKVHPADAVINLAGAGLLDWPWTTSRRQELYNSRIAFTQQLAAELNRLETPPKIVVHANAIGYYGMEKTASPASESTPAGTDWSGILCSAWEDAGRLCPADRLVSLRFGVVLDKRGGALARMLPAFKLGLGGIIGDGQQTMAWVALEDVLDVLIWSLECTQMQGAYNITATETITNSQFTEQLANQLNRPAWFRVPSIILRLIFKEGSELLTKGVAINNQKIKESGFVFKYDKFEDFLRS